MEDQRLAGRGRWIGESDGVDYEGGGHGLGSGWGNQGVTGRGDTRG